ASFLRDYDVVAYTNGHQFLYRFTHCTSAWITTAVADQGWFKSWDNVFTDYASWERAGAPDGYVWGVCYSIAYPGAKYVEDSELASEWSRRLGQQMHEVRIETNGHDIGLIFHDLDVRELKESDEEWVKDSLRSIPDRNSS
ncbi:MAG TPA: hypothetical protein VGR40_03765, partial [Candidatus Binatus sp.]|nr:hypothetical protein [Candidatus Binatus sp.]